MVNQQLIDYVKSQLQVGVGKDVIKNALLESGWAEADVMEALKQASAAQGATAQSATPSTGNVRLPDGQGSASGGKSPTTVSGGGVMMTSDIFQPKNEQTFDPKVTAGAVGKTQPASVPGKSTGPVLAGAAAASVSYGGKKFSGSMVTIALGVGFVVCAGAAIFFFMQKADLAAQLAPLEAARTEADGLKQQVIGLQQERDELAAQVTQTQKSNVALANDLAIFQVPDGTAPGATGNIVVTGALRQENAQFTVFTPNEVTVIVKNGKDAKVAAALQALVGNTVTLSGTHVIGSREMTVTTVNGAAIE